MARSWFSVLGCAHPLTLTWVQPAIHLYTYTFTYLHLVMCPSVNEHVKSALAEDLMDDEVAGPRSLLTAPRGVLPPQSLPPT